MAGGVGANPKIPPINRPLSASPDAVVNVTTSIKSAIDIFAGRTGGALDRAVTLQDLVTLGLVSEAEIMSKLAGTG